MATDLLGGSPGVREATGLRAHSARRAADGRVRHAASARTPRPWWQRVLHASAALVVVGVAAGFALVSRANHAYITTPSMYPTIPPGAMVFISPRRSYHVGEVIEFHANGLLWVHRLIAIRPNGDFVTKGDNPQSTPDVFSPPTTGRDVVGVVTRTVPYLGFPQLFVNHPAYALGWLRAELGTRGRVAALVAAAGLALFVALGGRTSDRSGTRRRRAHAARAR